MSYLKRFGKVLFLLWGFSVILISGCGDQQSGAIFDPETGKHATTWVDTHRDRVEADITVCYECHGEDLQGGISSVSCFTCHGHDIGWSNPDLHGATAKAMPGNTTGFQSCRECHGDDFSGEILSGGCSSAACHAPGTPHPAAAAWNGTVVSNVTHTDTHWQNTDVCAICHQNPAPPPGGAPVNCFNNTLCHDGGVVHTPIWNTGHSAAARTDSAACATDTCHGTDLQGGVSTVNCFSPDLDGLACHGSGITHVADWDNPDLHGATAKAMPGNTTGFQSCRECHGDTFNSGMSCSTASCHNQGMPHSPTPWNGAAATRTHKDTRVHNSDVCAICHLGEASAPPPGGAPVNCFNNTLCHNTSEGHSGASSWETDHSLTARSDNFTCATAACHGTDYTGGGSGVGCYDCHLGGPNSDPNMMHPTTWTSNYNDHQDIPGKDATSCSPTRTGIAQYCHGDGLPDDYGQLTDPPNGSWGGNPTPTCWECHNKEWSTP